MMSFLNKILFQTAPAKFIQKYDIIFLAGNCLIQVVVLMGFTIYNLKFRDMNAITSQLKFVLLLDFLLAYVILMVEKKDMKI